MDELKELKEGMKRKEIILIACNCTVDYNGRAQSYLAEGDRIVIIKPDGTLLVHQPSGSNPINYMKDQTEYQILKEKGILAIKAKHSKINEYMDIEISKVYSITRQKLKDSEKLRLVGNEKDMSDMIFNKPELVEKGLKSLSREEHTEFGFVDVLCKDKKGNLVVVECKRYGADYKAISQLKRYVKKIKQSKGIDNVRGILASPTISDSSKKYLKEAGFKHVSLEPPKYKEKYRKEQKNLFEF